MPDFLRYGFSIAGVQKAGTSTLSQTLNWHPHVLKAPRKEVRFFLREGLDWSDPPYRRYRVKRTKPQQRIVGDATPAYLYWPHALERMRDYDPDMRLVAIFRDPIERAFSHWTMMRGRNPDRSDWPDVLTQHRATRLPLELPPKSERRLFTHEPSVIPRGYYAAQLERGLGEFPREQWLLLEFRSMLADFEPTVHRVTDFLGIRRFRKVPPLRQALAGPPAVVGTAPTADDLVGLADLYADDLARFAELSGLPIEAWSTRRILEGTLDPAELAARLATRVEPAGLDQGRA